MRLPFLVIHGAWVWKLALIGFVALSLAALALVRKLRAHRHAVRMARDLDRAGLVRGTLGGGRIATLDIDHVGMGIREHRHRDAELWIETAEGRVVLDGDIRVVAGSRMTTARRRVPKRTPPAIAGQSKIYVAALREVAPGDRVVARGVLASEPSAEPSDYREGKPVTVLRADDAPIAIAALSPRGSAVRLPWIGIAALAGVLAFAGYRIEVAMGNSWRTDCFADRGDDESLDDAVLSNTHACVLANAMPDEPYVLEHLFDRLQRTPVTSDDDIAQRFELAHLALDCDRSIYFAHVLPHAEQLLAEATRCGNRAVQQTALVRLGDFDAAANLGPFQNRGTLFVLTRRWSEAADLARRHAEEAAAREDLNVDEKAVQVQRWRCIAELMRWNAGDRDALARVYALAPGQDSACRAELVEMTTGAERERLLVHSGDRDARQRAYQGVRNFDEWRTFELQRSLAGEPEEITESPARALALAAGDAHVWHPGLWGAKFAPEPTGHPLEVQLRYYAARVVPDVYDGDLVAAHRDADRALEIAGKLNNVFDARELAILHALVDLRGPRTDTPFDNGPAEDHVTLNGELQRFLMTEIYLRQGMSIRHAAILRTDTSALEDAQHGDGSRLVPLATVARSRVAPFEILAVLPRVRTARAELVHAMRWSPLDSDMVGYEFPWSTMAAVAERRALFEVGGDHEEAARWGAIYARYRGAIADRKVLIALTLWGNE